MRLTLKEIDVLLGMLGDVDPAHFESYEEPERTRRETAYDRAKEKLTKRYWELKEKGAGGTTRG